MLDEVQFASDKRKHGQVVRRVATEHRWAVSGPRARLEGPRPPPLPLVADETRGEATESSSEKSQHARARWARTASSV